MCRALCDAVLGEGAEGCVAYGGCGCDGGGDGEWRWIGVSVELRCSRCVTVRVSCGAGMWEDQSGSMCGSGRRRVEECDLGACGV